MDPGDGRRVEIDLDRVRRRRMVGWYDPEQLSRTGIGVIVSTLFGRHSDSRLHDAVATDSPVLDYRRPSYCDDDGSFGFDYVADTGDGWNSTYAVASAVSQPMWHPRNGEPLKRGRLLVLGGDLVYPYPSRERYEHRLIGPFAVAGRYIDPGDAVEMLAIPGNHDWYDSLVNFRRIFCCDRRMAAWQTRQTRSYFAARLPAGWWLFGLDMQLDGDIDEPQARFFNGIVDGLEAGERVIMCLPEPAWLKEWEAAESLSYSLVDGLTRRLGERLRVRIAGDLHHYQRHSTTDGRHVVTCGLGGAFLHPTHGTSVDPTGEFTHACSFPTQPQSHRLTYWNLRFVSRNPWFGVVPAIAYLLAAWQNGLAVGECFGGQTFPPVCIQEMGTLGLSRWREAVAAGFHSALLSPIGMAFYGLIFWGFIFFADKRSPGFRYTVGAVHAVTHIVAGFLIYWFGVYVAITLAGFTPKSVPQYVVTGTLIFVLSWVIGSIVLGLYLLISLNVFGAHNNEAFSSLRIQDWKGFLRFRVHQDGRLTMRFVGFEKIPRKWRVASLTNGRTVLVPADAAVFVGDVVDEIAVAGESVSVGPGVASLL